MKGKKMIKWIIGYRKEQNYYAGSEAPRTVMDLSIMDYAEVVDIYWTAKLSKATRFDTEEVARDILRVLNNNNFHPSILKIKVEHD